MGRKVGSFHSVLLLIVFFHPFSHQTSVASISRFSLPYSFQSFKMAEGFKLYHYNPSSGAAIPFAALFGLTTVVHMWQLGRNRSWYFIPFLIGGLCMMHSSTLSLSLG
jgi:hypothetical protein